MSKIHITGHKTCLACKGQGTFQHGRFSIACGECVGEGSIKIDDTIECDGSLCAGNPTNENMHICNWCDKTEFGVFPDEYTEKGNDNE